MADFDYLKVVAEDSDTFCTDVQNNVELLLTEELGMRRVMKREELVDGTFIVGKSPVSVQVTCTLDDRPFVGGLLYKMWREEATKKWRGGMDVTVTQLRKSYRYPSPERSRKFGDKVWRLNPKKNGIEVSFSENPGEKMTACLKQDHAFKWSKHQGIWYGKDTPANRKLMLDMALTQVADAI